MNTSGVTTIARRGELGRARKVTVPAGSLAATAFAVTDYADAYAIDLPNGDAIGVDTLTRLLVTSAPRWADQLMWLRNRLVSVVGLRTSANVASPTLIGPLQPGDLAGRFRVLARSENEILFGGDDRHLNFRASMLVRADAGRSYAVLTTVVHFNNWFGRGYFFVIRPFHRLIVASLLRNMRRRLAPLRGSSIRT